MKTILTLAWMRIRITLRNKAFLFFSLFMPMGIFFAYCSLLAKGAPDTNQFLDGPDSFLHRDGHVLGIEHATGDLARAGDSAAVPPGADFSGEHDRLQHRGQLCVDPAHGHCLNLAWHVSSIT